MVTIHFYVGNKYQKVHIMTIPPPPCHPAPPCSVTGPSPLCPSTYLLHYQHTSTDSSMLCCPINIWTLMPFVWTLPLSVWIWLLRRWLPGNIAPRSLHMNSFSSSSTFMLRLWKDNCKLPLLYYAQVSLTCFNGYSPSSSETFRRLRQEPHWTIGSSRFPNQNEYL